MKIKFILIVLSFYCASHTVSAQCIGYPCDTVWYDENGRLKDEFVVTEVYFEFGKAILVGYPFDSIAQGSSTHQTQLKLDSLAMALKEDGGKFEIQCHTDCRGSNNYSMNLSGQRARSVMNYLVWKGVKEINLMPRGYDESRPRKISDAGQDISLTCAYIRPFMEKDETLYEFYHQLNRRVVVKRLV